MYPGVCYECAEPSQYPVLSNPAVPLDKFLAVKNSRTPVVLNYSQQMIDTALARIAAKAPPTGMSQEMTHAKGHVIDDAEDFDFGGVDDDCGDGDGNEMGDDDEIYHVLNPLIKEISKREQQLTDDMKEFLERKVARLVVLTQRNAVGRFNPPSMDDDDETDDAEMEAEDEMDDDDMDDEDADAEERWTSLSYPTDTRSHDERIKQPWERNV